MSIFKSEPVAAETPESLASILTEAQIAREATIHEAELVFGAEKAYVTEQASSRIHANEALVAELEAETKALHALLFPAGSDSLDEQA